MNKFEDRTVAGSGGIVTVLGFVAAVFLFIAYRTFYLQTTLHLIEILSIVAVVFFLTGIGLVDDLLGWQRGGLSRRSRIIMVLLAAIPLIVINAGKHVIELPFLGVVNLGLTYPLVIIPLGIVGAATTFNFLAGFNGLEGGQGVLLLSALGIVAYFTGNPWLTVIAFCMVSALLGFLVFNFNPATVFPGDSLTYAVGGLIAAIPILGNFEKIAVFFYIPYIIEVILKSRGKLVKQSFGKPNKEGLLDLPYPKIYSLNHIAIWLLKKANIRSTEQNAVILLWIFQIVVILLGFAIFRQGIFIQ